MIDCTGDCVVGDDVKFERAVFTGSFRNPKFSHNETIEGKIIAESYGEKTQQHTFTILLSDGKKIKIKGRNLYKNGTLRKKWENEKDREIALQEKHKRGDYARNKRDIWC